MSSKKRRHSRKTNAMKSAPKHFNCPGSKGSQSKKSQRAKRKKKGLTFDKICRLLRPKHEPMLIRFERYARWRGRRAKLPESEAVALEALVRAVVTFRSPSRSEEQRRKALFSWIQKKINYALLNLATQYPFTEVRDAFVEFERRFGYKPTLRELCRFSRTRTRRVKGRRVKTRSFGPRQVLNVWEQVAAELELTSETDTVMKSLLDEVKQGQLGVVTIPAESSYMARQVLARMRPDDACLIILKDHCCFTEEGIIWFLKRARVAASRFTSYDEMQERLDRFVESKLDGLAAPWDAKLLKIKKRGQLATRLHRARKRASVIRRRLETTK